MPTSPSTSPNTMPTFSQATALPEDTARHQRAPGKPQRGFNASPAMCQQAPATSQCVTPRPQHAPERPQVRLREARMHPSRAPERSQRAPRGPSEAPTPQQAPSTPQRGFNAPNAPWRGLSEGSQRPNEIPGRRKEGTVRPRRVLTRSCSEIPVRPSYGTVRPSEAPTRSSEAPTRPQVAGHGHLLGPMGAHRGASGTPRGP